MPQPEIAHNDTGELTFCSCANGRRVTEEQLELQQDHDDQHELIYLIFFISFV